MFVSLALLLALVALIGAIFWHNSAPERAMLRVARLLKIPAELLIPDPPARWLSLQRCAENRYTQLIYRLLPVAYRHRDLKGDEADDILAELVELTGESCSRYACRQLGDMCFFLEEYTRSEEDAVLCDELEKEFSQLHRAKRILESIQPRLVAYTQAT